MTSFNFVASYVYLHCLSLQSTENGNRGGNPRPAVQRNPPRKSKYTEYTTAPGNAVYFLFDIETTGSKRNWDRIIAFSFLCYDEDGSQLGSFSRKINPGNVRISPYLTEHVHSKLFLTRDC